VQISDPGLLPFADAARILECRYARLRALLPVVRLRTERF
jgi:hypothetical protein